MDNSYHARYPFRKDDVEETRRAQADNCIPSLGLRRVLFVNELDRRKVMEHAQNL